MTTLQMLKDDYRRGMVEGFNYEDERIDLMSRLLLHMSPQELIEYEDELGREAELGVYLSPPPRIRN